MLQKLLYSKAYAYTLTTVIVNFFNDEKKGKKSKFYTEKQAK